MTEPDDVLTGEELAKELERDAELRSLDAIERRVKWEDAQARGLEFFSTTAHNVMARIIGLEGMITLQSKEIERLSKHIEEADEYRWRLRDVKKWADDLAEENRKLKVRLAKLVKRKR